MRGADDDRCAFRTWKEMCIRDRDMVVAGEYSDEGFSGKNIQGRQEFQRMLNDIQDCKDGVSYVLVFKPVSYTHLAGCSCSCVSFPLMRIELIKARTFSDAISSASRKGWAFCLSFIYFSFTASYRCFQIDVYKRQPLHSGLGSG